MKEKKGDSRVKTGECEESGFDTYRYIEYMKPRDWGSDDSDVFFVDSGVIQDGGATVAITAATKAEPVVITAAGHGFSGDELVRIRDVGGMVELNTTDSGFGVGIYTVKNVAGNDFEVDGNLDPTTVVITSLPSNGTVRVDTGTGDVTYTPEADFNGLDTFSYQVCDTNGQCDTADVTVDVGPTDDPPVALDDAGTVFEDGLTTDRRR